MYLQQKQSEYVDGVKTIIIRWCRPGCVYGAFKLDVGMEGQSLIFSPLIGLSVVFNQFQSHLAEGGGAQFNPRENAG